MVSVEPLKFLTFFLEDSKFTHEEITRESLHLHQLNSLSLYGVSGQISYRLESLSTSPVHQLLGLRHDHLTEADSTEFGDRYGHLSISLATNSPRLEKDAQKLLDLGCKKHRIISINTNDTIDNIASSILSYASDILQLEHPVQPALYHVCAIHLSQDEINNDTNIWQIIEKVLSQLKERAFLQLPPPNWGEAPQPLENELFIKTGALTAALPKQLPHTLWVSVVTPPFPFIAPRTLLAPSHTILFGSDISQELSPNVLGFVHCCPGHARIDDQQSFCIEAFQNGGSRTIRAEQYLSELAYRLHATPKFGA